MFKKSILGAVLVAVSLVVLPSVSSANNGTIGAAQQVEQMQALIASLLQQVQELQAKLAQLQGNNGVAWCHTFNIDLGVGTNGGEVSSLVGALEKEKMMPLGSVGVLGASVGSGVSYDEKIASAVSAFQEKYANEVLNPVGLVHGTGYLGARTRAKLNSLYGCTKAAANQTQSGTDSAAKISVDHMESEIGGINTSTVGAKVIIYGTGLNTEGLQVRLVGKAEDKTVVPFDYFDGGMINDRTIKFIVPSVDAGEYDLFLSAPGQVSNKIKVNITSASVNTSSGLLLKSGLVQNNGSTKVTFMAVLSDTLAKSSAGLKLKLECPEGVTANSAGGFECGETNPIIGNSIDIWFTNSTSQPKTVTATAYVLSGIDSRELARQSITVSIPVQTQ